MEDPENQKAITICNLNKLTVSQSKNVSFITAFLSSKLKLSTLTVNKFNWNNPEVFSVAFGSLNNYFVCMMGGMDLPSHHEIILLKHCNRGLVTTSEAATYANLDHLTTIIYNYTYNLISEPADPQSVYKDLLKEIKLTKSLPTPHQDKKNQIMVYNNPKPVFQPKFKNNFNSNNFRNNYNNNNNNFKNRRNNNNGLSKKPTPDPKDCFWCSKGKCRSDSHRLILEARGRF